MFVVSKYLSECVTANNLYVCVRHEMGMCETVFMICFVQKVLSECQ